jgi:hypothetical protein
MLLFSRRLFFFTTLSSASVALASCDIVSFDVAQNIPEQTVPGSPLGALLPSFLPTPFAVTIDVKEETAKRDTGPASSANLSNLSFSITPHSAPSGNFDFVDEIHIYVETTQSSSLPKIEIAKLSPVPKGRTNIQLDLVPNVDLLPYINAGATISAQASGHQPAQDTSYDGAVVVTVHI